jgi:ribosomal protein S18 acetylase RimI-like enzyme
MFAQRAASGGSGMSDVRIVLDVKTARGDLVTIRYALADDCAAMHAFINALSIERTFISFQGEEIGLEEERAYLNTQLKRTERHEEVRLYAWCDGRLVASSGIGLKAAVCAHVGVFGIAVARDFRGRGIGSLLMKTVLEEAEREIPTLRLVTLAVFGNNPHARALYERFGFEEYGRLPGGILHRGEYVDDVLMQKKVR